VAWIYLAVEITIYAAEVNTVLFHRLWPRGMVQPPLTEADQKSLALQATENQRRPEQVVTTRFRSRPMQQDEYRERGYQPDESQPGIERHTPEDAAVFCAEDVTVPLCESQIDRSDPTRS
jgi:hypothetical protein